MKTTIGIGRASIAAAIGLAIAAPLSAQQLIEEITVTARKREETLQDVPFSIVAQTEEKMRNLGASNIEEVANNIAGFTVQSLGPGQSQPAIRGISAGQIVRDLPGVKEQVGVYLDESVISLSLFTPDLDLFDLNRVEVLRGPQGTLFGSGSLAGTVRYITNQPALGEYEGYGEASGSFLDDGEFGGNVKGVVNVPMGDRVALRATGYYNSLNGFIDAIQPGGTVDDVNGGDRYGARVALRIEPNDRFSITPRVLYQNIDVDGFNRQDIFNILANPFTTTRPAVTIGEREQFTQLEEKFEDEFLLVDATIDYDFGPVTLTSVTSFTDRDILVRRDATALTASITAQPNILNQPEAVYTIDAPLDDVTTIEVLTQELRVSSNNPDGIQWVAGIFYSDIERNYGQSLFVNGFEAATGIPTAGPAAGTDILFFSNIPYDFEQTALFGEITFPIGDRFDITAGGRFFDFEESRILTFDGIFAVQTINVPATTASDGFSPRVIASFAATDNVQLNAQVSKGFRLGGVNDPLNAPLCSAQDLLTYGGRPSFKDEELWNYEVGAKTAFWNGRGTFNIALFYSDIKDLQAPLDAGTCSSRVIFNVPDAHTAGVEFELAAQVTDSFDFGLSMSVLEAEFDSTVTDVNGTPLGGLVDGNSLPTAPEFQAAANATYTWQAFSDYEGFVVGTVQHVGERTTQPVDQLPGFDTIDLQITPIGAPSQQFFTFDPILPSYEIANLRLGFRNEQYEFALFVNNLTDEDARLSLDRERGGRARVGYQTNQPRTFGVSARVNF